MSEYISASYSIRRGVENALRAASEREAERALAARERLQNEVTRLQQLELQRQQRLAQEEMKLEAMQQEEEAATQALSAAKQRQEEEQSRFRQYVAAREEKKHDLERRQTSREAQAHADAQAWQDQRQQRETEARDLLDWAERRAELCRQQYGPAGDMQTRLESLRESLRLFGPTPALLRELRYVGEREIPALMGELSQQESLKRLRPETRRRVRLALSSFVQDDSNPFVHLGLRGETAEEASQRQTPWGRFSTRLREAEELALALDEDDLAQDAVVLLREGEGLAPRQRGAFAARHVAALESLSEELDGLLDYALQQEKEREALWRRCQYLCQCLEIEPPLSAQAELPLLENTVAALEQREMRQREQAYFIETLSQVLDANGITFESMSTQEDGLHLSYVIDSRTGISVQRSTTGALSITFDGYSAGAEASQDELVTFMEGANTFCSQFRDIQKALEERGIVLGDDLQTRPPNPEQIHVVQRQMVRQRQGEEYKVMARP